MRHELLDTTRGHLYQFDSLQETVDIVSKHQKVDNWDYSFLGRSFNRFSQVIEATNSLWKEGMDLYQEMFNQLEQEHVPPPRSIKRKQSWSEEGGDELDLDRLRNQQPYWLTTRKRKVPEAITVTILTDLGGRAYVKSREMFWRGVSSVLCTELLERSGYRVELWGVHRSNYVYSYSNRGIGVAIRLKELNQPLDVSSLVNAVSGWFYRTVIFGCMDITPETVCGSRGGTVEINDVVEEVSQDPQLLISQDIWSKEQAINWVKTQLAKFNQTQPV